MFAPKKIPMDTYELTFCTWQNEEAYFGFNLLALEERDRLSY